MLPAAPPGLDQQAAQVELDAQNPSKVFWSSLCMFSQSRQTIASVSTPERVTPARQRISSLAQQAAKLRAPFA